MSHHCSKECIEENHEKIEWILYVTAILLFITTFFIQNNLAKIIIYGISTILAGYEVLLNGFKNIFHLNFEEDTLMTIAVIAAFCIGEYPEAVLVLVLFRLGEFLEDMTLKKSQKNIEEIALMKENMANIVENDEIKTVKAEEVKIGDVILVKPGEKIPLDGSIVSGTSNLDTSAITGESNPVSVSEGEKVFSGSVNLSGALKIKVEKDLEHSMVAQIANLVQEASNNKGEKEKFITKFSKIYTPIVICLAIAFTIISTITGWLDLKEAINRSLIFLVAACPCSIAISIPLTFFACVGSISKKGMLIKGTKHIEELSKADTIAFDKTGTLTTGKMKIDEINWIEQSSKEEVLSYIASLEALSNHPIGLAILEEAKDVQKKDVRDYKEIAGHGLYGIIDEKEVVFGNKKLLEKYGVEGTEEDKNYLAVNKQLLGSVSIVEEVLDSNKRAVYELETVGIKNKIMLTGDNSNQAEKIANEYGINTVYSSLLPNEKQEVINELKQENKKVIFVGDGINDAPVLAEADFGISMGAGTEIANITSDAILMNNQISTIPKAIKVAKKAMGIVKFNIVFSLGVKAIVLLLGALGVAPMWLAVLADTGVSVITVVNVVRIMR